MKTKINNKEEIIIDDGIKFYSDSDEEVKNLCEKWNSINDMLNNDKNLREDCIKIQEIFKKHNYKISLEEAYELWSNYSQNIYYASWMPVELSTEEFNEDMLPIAKIFLNKV